jgi:hypothetical protein
VSQRHDVQQCDVALAAFDAAHIIAMEIRQLRKLFLREPTLQPKLTEASAEHGSRVGISHPAIIRT